MIMLDPLIVPCIIYISKYMQLLIFYMLFILNKDYFDTKYIILYLTVIVPSANILSFYSKELPDLQMKIALMRRRAWGLRFPIIAKILYSASQYEVLALYFLFMLLASPALGRTMLRSLLRLNLMRMFCNELLAHLWVLRNPTFVFFRQSLYPPY